MWHDLLSSALVTHAALLAETVDPADGIIRLFCSAYGTFNLGLLC